MIPISPQNTVSLQKSIQILKNGGIIAHPADTCYGLAGDFLNPDTLKKIQGLKGRSGKKPMSVMLPLSQKNKIGEYTELDDFSTQVCERLLPGPVTLLLPKGIRAPDWYFPETDLIGIRIPDNEGVQALLEAFGGPLITTSANASGEVVCESAGAVAEVFGGQEGLELILERDDGELGQPSTVVCVVGGEIGKSRLQVLRHGPMTERDIRERLKGVDFEIVS